MTEENDHEHVRYLADQLQAAAEAGDRERGVAIVEALIGKSIAEMYSQHNQEFVFPDEKVRDWGEPYAWVEATYVLPGPASDQPLYMAMASRVASDNLKFPPVDWMPGVLARFFAHVPDVLRWLPLPDSIAVYSDEAMGWDEEWEARANRKEPEPEDGGDG